MRPSRWVALAAALCLTAPYSLRASDTEQTGETEESPTTETEGDGNQAECIEFGKDKNPELLPDDDELLPVRPFDVFGQLVVHGDGFPKPRVAIGPSVEVLLNFDDERRYRLGIHGGLQIGPWGDHHHGLLSFETGISYRHAISQDEVFNFYSLVRPAFIVDTTNARLGGRVDGGFGVGIAGTLAIEATYQPVVSLDEPFLAAGDEYRVTHGASLSLGLNACTLFDWCDPTEVQPELVDCNKSLYAEARTWASDRAAIRPLCDAFHGALNVYDHYPGPGEDEMDALLRTIDETLAVGAGYARDAVQSLRAKHGRLKAGRHYAHGNVRRAKRCGRQVRYTIAYAPTAIELRDALRCPPEHGKAWVDSEWQPPLGAACESQP